MNPPKRVAPWLALSACLNLISFPLVQAAESRDDLHGLRTEHKNVHSLQKEWNRLDTRQILANLQDRIDQSGMRLLSYPIKRSNQNPDLPLEAKVADLTDQTNHKIHAQRFAILSRPDEQNHQVVLGIEISTRAKPTPRITWMMSLFGYDPLNRSNWINNQIGESARVDLTQSELNPSNFKKALSMGVKKLEDQQTTYGVRTPPASQSSIVRTIAAIGSFLVSPVNASGESIVSAAAKIAIALGVVIVVVDLAIFIMGISTAAEAGSTGLFALAAIAGTAVFALVLIAGGTLVYGIIKHRRKVQSRQRASLDNKRPTSEVAVLLPGLQV